MRNEFSDHENEGHTYRFQDKEGEGAYRSLNDIEPGALSYGDETNETTLETKAIEPSLEEFVITPDHKLRTIELPAERELEHYVTENIWQQMSNDPEIRAALPAIARLLANIGVTIADMPGTSHVGGEFVFLLTQGLKHWKSTNILTPNVATKKEFRNEVFDIISCGFLPSHAAATYEQFKHDKPAIDTAFRRACHIMNEDRQTKQRTITRRAAGQFRTPNHHDEDHHG